MAASISKSITLPKVGQNAANYLQGARQFLPENQICPVRSLDALGYPQFAVDNFGRLAATTTVNTSVGYCGGQFSTAAATARAIGVERPDYIVKQGPLNGGLPVASFSGAQNDGVLARVDTLNFAGMKANSSRFSDLTSPALNPMFNPIATATSGAEARQCLGELQFAALAKSTAAANKQVPSASKYAAAGDVELNLGQPNYENYLNAYSAYLPVASSTMIP